MKWQKVFETGVLVFLLIAGVKLGQAWTQKALPQPTSGNGSGA